MIRVWPTDQLPPPVLALARKFEGTGKDRKGPLQAASVCRIFFLRSVLLSESGRVGAKGGHGPARATTRRYALWARSYNTARRCRLSSCRVRTSPQSPSAPPHPTAQQERAHAQRAGIQLFVVLEGSAARLRCSGPGGTQGPTLARSARTFLGGAAFRFTISEKLHVLSFKCGPIDFL